MHDGGKPGRKSRAKKKVKQAEFNDDGKVHDEIVDDEKKPNIDDENKTKRKRATSKMAPADAIVWAGHNGSPKPPSPQLTPKKGNQKC